jgi:hypothetical protein
MTTNLLVLSFAFTVFPADRLLKLNHTVNVLSQYLSSFLGLIGRLWSIVYPGGIVHRSILSCVYILGFLGGLDAYKYVYVTQGIAGMNMYIFNW